MARYRENLPQLAGRLFLTDSGMETTLIFHEGVDLPCFASFDLLKDEAGLSRTRAYYERHIALAKRHDLGFVLESPTWRANPDWGAWIGYSLEALAQANRRAVRLMAELRDAHESPQCPMVISGNIGPRGDGYKVGNAMSAAEAEDYHAWQIRIFRDTEADMVSAFTINYVEEAVGVARAAKAAGMPSVISFTVETDGRLPSGQPLREAVEQVDRETGRAPAYYMINCAHPKHFEGALQRGEAWLERLRGIRANASKRSHAELDAAADLDIGNPVELGREYRSLRDRLRQITVLGGCCGTDHRHIEQICLACTEVAA
ncbi:MAG TPA: homocysteine S-methyltransferase family protein [Xanthobacteraceae bacterium]|nr:homocysteine S-methyltransferase family protein [Xanthobacteraceae bacterium]